MPPHFGSDDWRPLVLEIDGLQASHYDLVKLVERLGFEVLSDPHHEDRSIVALPESNDCENREIGEIVGFGEATFRITVNLT
jgi:hypothetical protein